MTIFPSNQTQDGKEKAVFRCSVTGGYPPGNIQWQFNNKRLESGAKYTINEDDGSLLIKNLQFRGRSDSGNYTCVVTSDAGSISMSAHLSVAPVLGKRFVSDKYQKENLVLSNELIKVELPP